MRDSRVTVFTNPSAIAVGGTVTGPTISLLADYVGDRKYGTSLYGFGVELMAKNLVIGTDADGATLVWKFQVSPDGTNWTDGDTIGTMAFSAAGLWTKDGTVAGATHTLVRSKLRGRLRTIQPYARIVCTSGDLEGTATINLYGWISDGTEAFNTGVLS
jgi:hypothetical protein